MARLCLFVADEGGHRCRSCGFYVTIRGGTGTPRAVCGRPETLRVLHGDVAGGPGTVLKRLLAQVGIHAGPGCKCGERARVMDERGPEWCESNLDEIVGWLEEEAKSRRIPLFSRAAARMLVKKAIQISRSER